jgi:hypothetical protein
MLKLLLRGEEMVEAMARHRVGEHQVAVAHPGARDDLDPALFKEVSTNV